MILYGFCIELNVSKPMVNYGFLLVFLLYMSVGCNLKRGSRVFPRVRSGLRRWKASVVVTCLRLYDPALQANEP